MLFCSSTFNTLTWRSDWEIQFWTWRRRSLYCLLNVLVWIATCRICRTRQWLLFQGTGQTCEVENLSWTFNKQITTSVVRFKTSYNTKINYEKFFFFWWNSGCAPVSCVHSHSKLLSRKFWFFDFHSFILRPKLQWNELFYLLGWKIWSIFN